MKALLLIAGLFLMGCNTTKVVVVTVVTKTNSNNDLEPSEYYEGTMSKDQVKKLLDDTIDSAIKDDEKAGE